MFEPGLRVGLAVSGGADSMCLLHLLHCIGPQWNLQLSVIHIDHGIREEASRADADFVREAAAGYGVPFHIRALQIPEVADNLEQAARDARLAFFAELMASGQIDRVATGHTQSDQAETVLFRILRGSGFAGLRGILPHTDSHIVRPLLDVTRTEVEEWMRAGGFGWRIDETNSHRTYARNRLRHDILPQLREAFNPNLDAALAQLADLAREEEEYWSDALPPPPLRDGACYFHVEELTTLAPAVARRKIRRAVEGVKGNLRQVDYLHVDAILEMARSPLGSGRGQLPGLDVFRSFEWLRIAPAGFDSNRPRDFQVPVEVPGTALLPADGARIRFQLQDYEEKFQDRDKVESELDWERLTYPTAPDAAGETTARSNAGSAAIRAAKSGLLELRNWRPGDQYRRIGESHEKKIKLLFQEHRIPLWERRSWPVLTDGDRVLWTRRFGAAADFAPAPGTRTVLHIQENLAE